MDFAPDGACTVLPLVTRNPGRDDVVSVHLVHGNLPNLLRHLSQQVSFISKLLPGMSRKFIDFVCFLLKAISSMINYSDALDFPEIWMQGQESA